MDDNWEVEDQPTAVNANRDAVPREPAKDNREHRTVVVGIDHSREVLELQEAAIEGALPMRVVAWNYRASGAGDSW
eukprot:NODE_18266_length_901_cov_7.894057.p5 GENE.NODE_18266_length_901_cov_7.894057~~NODE_18266_length_901_cov_7.894057.p5  ORF type:complete len:76 (-),score=18.09 NODE_18266_length_901_cov_7.894057:463-690(-)